jgi:urease accessory protein
MPRADTDIITVTTITIMDESLLPLLVWLSPNFPTGAFAYSHGLEWAVDSGDIKNATTLSAWLADLLAHGATRADSVLLAMAYCRRDHLKTNELALALANTRERRLETSTQGNAFLTAIQAAWPAPVIDVFATALGEDDVAYPVIVGIAAAAHNLALRQTLEAFALAAISNLVSAVVRLGPIGQREAQGIIAESCPAIARLAAFAEAATPDDLGTSAWRCDIAAMRHETQYSRLFRS